LLLFGRHQDWQYDHQVRSSQIWKFSVNYI
jgi:hypothetical protein